MVIETELKLAGGRTLHVYDTAPESADARLVIFWHHGTPNTGEPPAPLLPAAAQRGIRWVSYDRPGYGTSTRRPGRNLASAADDTVSVANALGIDRFAVMGHSGGASHALACAGLLPDRVLAAVCVSAVAPYDATGLDWFAGMVATGAAKLRAAAAGPAALTEYLATDEFNPEEFTPADHAALAGAWSWLGRIAGQAIATDAGGTMDDELTCATPWGFDPAGVRQPVLFVHGGEDRIAPRGHGEWLARRCPSAELWLRSDDGHISVLSEAEAALDWLFARANPDGVV